MWYTTLKYCLGDGDTWTNNTLQKQNITEAIVYTSSNEKVATVDATGKVTAKVEGSTRITASANGVSATYTITVYDKALYEEGTDGKYQIANRDFEDWTNVSSTNAAPYNWNAYQTANATSELNDIKSAVQVTSGSGCPGGNGLYCAEIFSADAKGNVITGVLTTGELQLASETLSSSSNNIITKRSDKKMSETISAIPDAMKVWVKFEAAGNGNKASISATIHDNYDYISYATADQESSNADNDKHAIAKVRVQVGATNSWQEITYPFTENANFSGDKNGTKYIVANFMTSSTLGGGTVGDRLYVDDILLLYYSEIKDAKYNGEAITFTNGAATINAAYDPKALEYGVNGYSATHTQAYNPSTGVLTIRVMGADFSANPTNYHDYTIQFKATPSTYTERVAGEATSAPKEVGASFAEYEGQVGLVFSGVVLEEGGEAQTLTIPVNYNEGIYTYEGNVEGVGDVNLEAWVDDADGEIRCILSVDDKRVVVAPVLEIGKESDLVTNEATYKGLHNYKYTRTLKQGWNTIGLPFDWSADDFGGLVEEVREFSSVKNEDQTLIFSLVSDTKNLKAHYPYLVKLKEAISTPIYFGTEIESVAPTTVTQGEGWSYTARYYKYVVTGSEGSTFYGIVNKGLDNTNFMQGGAGASFGCTVGVFEYKGAQTAPDLMSIGLDDSTVGIPGASSTAASNDKTYDLSGRRTKANEQGVYVVGGKKVIK